MDAGLLTDTKRILRSLIISAPKSISIQQLSKDYRSTEGTNIPYGRLGYGNLESFLRTISDTLTVDRMGNVSAVLSKDSEHIDKLVSKQRTTSKRSRTNHRLPDQKRYVPQRLQRNRYVPHNNNRPPLLNTPNMLPIQAFHQQYPSYTQQIANQQMMHNRLMYAQYAQQPYNDLRQHHYNVNLLHRNLQQNNIPPRYQPNTNNYKPQRPTPTNNHHVSNDRNLLPPDYKSAQLPPAPKVTKPIVPVLKTPSPVPEPATILKPPKTPEPVVSRVEKEPADIKSRNVAFDATEYYKMISPHSNDSYNGAPDITLDVSCQLSELQISSSKSSNSLNNGVAARPTACVSNGDSNNIRFGKSILKERLVVDVDDEKAEDALPSFEDDDPIFSINVPKGVSKYGTKILPSVVPAHILDKTEFHIYISEIHSPYRFWFQYADGCEVLDELMHDIELCYEQIEETNSLRLDPICIRRGQIVCAQFKNMWHRGEIVGDLIDDAVKVYFVDYGTTAAVNVRCLKYLIAKFAEPPSQVHRGSLAYIAPTGIRWQREATYFFLNLVSDLILYAKAVEVNREENVVSMLIIDTNQEEDKHINNAIITQGYAKLYTECCGPKGSEKKKLFCGVYPTFEALEYSEYPSFADIGIQLSFGIDFYALEDQNLIHDVDAPKLPFKETATVVQMNTNDDDECKSLLSESFYSESDESKLHNTTDFYTKFDHHIDDVDSSTTSVWGNDNSGNEMSNSESMSDSKLNLKSSSMNSSSSTTTLSDGLMISTTNPFYDEILQHRNESGSCDSDCDDFMCRNCRFVDSKLNPYVPSWFPNNISNNY